MRKLMGNLRKKLTGNKMAVFIIYFIVNILYLTKFPFVHSDEPWLSGLSRNIAENGDYSVTETFFDLYPRYPHAIKSLFHTIQIIFIEVFGYGIFSVRLISLVFGGLTLSYLYKLSKLILKGEIDPLIPSILMAIDVQFIYASHFARQEAIILFSLIFSMYYFYNNLEKHNIKHDIILGIIIGLNIGIHPNSFIINLPMVFIYVYFIMVKNLKLKNIVIYSGIVLSFAAIFVSISLKFNSNFFYDYFNFGKQFGVDMPIDSKVEGIKYFYYKLYYGISGTYYTPNIKPQFYIFGIILVLSLFKLVFNKKGEGRERDRFLPIALSIFAINIGTIIIGRYSQPSVVFGFPLFYILIAYVIKDVKLDYKEIITVGIGLIIFLNSIMNITPYLAGDYNNYLNEISKVVNKDNRVLANLNCEFYFENGKLFDYRNLQFLDENNMRFEDYIMKNKIEYIIYPEEMDVIYEDQPRWDGLYGELTYYKDMKEYFEEKCELIYEFKEPIYGMRIARYINNKQWTVKIYRVKDTL